MTITANQITGRAVGSLFFTGFGALWLVLSLVARERLNAASISTVAAGLIILASAAVLLMRQSRRFRAVPEDPEQTKAFNRINAVQWIAVAIVAFTFSVLHQQAYVPSAITAIVGLHLFPLARLFNYRMHHVTAISLVLWATVCLLALPVDRLQGITALGTGIILWLSAAIGLVIGAQAIRRTNPSHQSRLTNQLPTA